MIMKMGPFLVDEALQSTRKHAACTNGVRTNDRDFWTHGFWMIPRKTAFFLFVVNDPINP
jgi:hypothetical protein